MKSETIKVPSRLHLSVFDMREFGVGKMGGGGIGIGLEIFTTVTITENKEHDVVLGPHKNIIEAFIRYMKSKYHIDSFIKIIIKQNFLPHTGLGSTGSSVMATLLCINKYYSLNLAEKELLSIYFNNIVEQHNNQIVKCYETGVGPYIYLKGGLILLNSKSKLINHYIFNTPLSVLLILPSDIGKSYSFKKEVQLLESYGKFYDLKDKNKKVELFNKLNNSINKKDENDILHIINQLQNIGSKRAEIEYQNKIYVNLYSQLMLIGKDFNIKLCGLSSIGPCFCYIDYENIILELFSWLKYNLHDVSIFVTKTY